MKSAAALIVVACVLMVHVHGKIIIFISGPLNAPAMLLFFEES